MKGFNGRRQDWMRDGEYLLGPQTPYRKIGTGHIATTGQVRANGNIIKHVSKKFSFIG